MRVPAMIIMTKTFHFKFFSSIFLMFIFLTSCKKMLDVNSDFPNQSVAYVAWYMVLLKRARFNLHLTTTV